MGYILTGDQQRTANKRIGEILRQFGQDEYPYDPERTLDALQAFHEGRFDAVGVATLQPILRLISGGETLVIDETDGKETVAAAKEFFPGGIDLNFINWSADEASGPTLKTPVSVYELIRYATFSQMFGSVSTDPGRFCLTQSQIVGFVKKHRNWLRTGGYGTFFLFKSRGELFVAAVSFHVRARLAGGVFRFGYDVGWLAGEGHRLILPQL